jgi:hypothetical protein
LFDIVDPLKFENWNELILKHKDYSFFHSKEWAEVLIKSYDYSPKYFIHIENEKLLAVVPFIYIQSWLTGKKLVSLPFSDFCQPLICDSCSSEDVMKELLNQFSDLNIKYIEFRSTDNTFPFKTEQFRTDQRHVLRLDKDESSLLKSFSDNTKRNIKKANRENVKLRILNDVQGMKLFYKMNCETRKKHGLPPQPFIFFDQILKFVIERGYGDILFAEKDGIPISSAIYFKFGKKLLYKFGASYSKYFELRGNHFVMWEAIKKYLSEGFEEFDFGRTEIGHDGLRRFKIGWNTEELSIFTTRYNIKEKSFINASISTQGFHNKIFSNTPEVLLRAIGNILYKHIG